MKLIRSGLLRAALFGLLLAWIMVYLVAPASAQEATATPAPTPAPTPVPSQCVNPGAAPSPVTDAWIEAQNAYITCLAVEDTRAVTQATATQTALLVRGSDDQVQAATNVSYAALVGAWFMPVLLVAIVGGFVLRGPK